jgi:hypothetical protein
MHELGITLHVVRCSATAGKVLRRIEADLFGKFWHQQRGRLPPLLCAFSWSLRCAGLLLCRCATLGFFYVAPLRCATGLRQQGIVLFFARDGMSKLMP